MGMKRNIPIIASLVSFLLGTQAQSDECSCAPTSYRFTLDFDSNCTQYNSTDSIASTVCEIDFLGDAYTLDLTPISVDFVIVIELDENNTAIAQQNISQVLADGDSFEYVSSILVDPSTFPSAIQLNVYGSNAAGDAIVSLVAVAFTGNCAAYPVFMDGFSLGWLQFGALVPPPEGACSAFDGSTTASPTSTSITLSPTIAVTPAPSEPTTVTTQPSIAPSSVSTPTQPPGPTSGPIPTAFPTTLAPFPTPITMAPSQVMSLSMSLSMSMELSDYLMSNMVGEMDDFGETFHGKKAKTAKAASKNSKVSKKGSKAAKNGASPESDRDDGLSHQTSKESKASKKGTKNEANHYAASKQPEKDSKDGKRQRRLRLHPIET